MRLRDWSSDVCSSDLARKGQKAAEDLRKEEAKPFDDGKKAVQAKWTPITDEKKGKYALIIATAKKALAPWLVKLDAEQEAAREKARPEAAEAARKAIEAERAATASADLAAAENAEHLREQADQAAKIDRAHVCTPITNAHLV